MAVFSLSTQKKTWHMRIWMGSGGAAKSLIRTKVNSATKPRGVNGQLVRRKFAALLLTCFPTFGQKQIEQMQPECVEFVLDNERCQNFRSQPFCNVVRHFQGTSEQKVCFFHPFFSASKAFSQLLLQSEDRLVSPAINTSRMALNCLKSFWPKIFLWMVPVSRGEKVTGT